MALDGTEVLYVIPLTDIGSLSPTAEETTTQAIANLGFSGTITQNVTISSHSFGLSGNISAPAWTTSGIRYKNVAATLTDTTSSGTVSTAYTDIWGGNTIAASSATTFTNYYGSYFKVPVAGSNVTLTNNYALVADSIHIPNAASTPANGFSLGFNQVAGSTFIVRPSANGFTGTGTVTTNGTTAVVGVGTAFREEFSPGDTITVSGETQTVRSITNDTNLVTTTWTGSFSGSAFTVGNQGLTWTMFRNGNFRNNASVDSSNGATVLTIAKTQKDLALNTVLGTYNNSVTATSADTSTTAYTLEVFATIAANNTKNWTSGSPALSAVLGSINITAGATGTLNTGSASFFQVVNSASGFTITKGIGVNVGNPLITGTCTNYCGVYIAGSNTNVTNVCGLSIGSNPAPTGNYAIYDDTARAWSMTGTLSLGTLQLGNAYVATPPTCTGYVTLKDSTGTTYKVLVST